jgi:hypothetical protein
MIRRLFVLCVLAAVTPLAPASAGPVAGSWSAEISDRDPEKLQLSLRTGRSGQNGTTFRRADFTGLTGAQVRSITSVPVEFELRREAGTIAFTGHFRDGEGDGRFRFAPDPEYPKTLRRLGVALDGGRDEELELYHLALHDVSTDFIRSMQEIGYRVPVEKFIAFRIFDVDPEYVREMAAAGFPRLSADKLVETRIHGATPEYIRSMRAAGEDLTLDQYVESRIFRVTPEFAEEMGRAGYAGLRRDVLVQFRIHGVTTEYIDELRELGYAEVPAQKLVEMRIHGVTPEFIRRVANAGYRKVPVDKLVQMRIFNIEPEMVKALDATED